jgi:hypothetical protein
VTYSDDSQPEEQISSSKEETRIAGKEPSNKEEAESEEKEPREDEFEDDLEQFYHMEAVPTRR